MKALIVGTGGVGQSIAPIAKRRDPKGAWLEKMVMADYDAARRRSDCCAKLNDPRFVAEQVDAGDPDAVAALAKKHGVDIICNLCAPELQPAAAAGRPQGRDALPRHGDDALRAAPDRPDRTSAASSSATASTPLSPEFEKIGKYALAGFGVEPGMADYFARYAADHLFDEIDEIGIRDGSNLEIPGAKGIASASRSGRPSRSAHNPAIIWENGKGWHTIEPFAELEKFWLPEGIGEVEVGHVEHEEVIQIGRNADRLKGVKKATFKYALGDEFMQAMEIFKSVNIDKKEQDQGRRRRGRAARRDRRRRPRPERDRQEVRRPDGRRHLGDGQEGRHGARGLPLPGRRQPGVRAEVRHPGRRRPDRLHAGHHRSSCSPPASLGTSGDPEAACTTPRSSAPTTSSP